MAASNCVRSLTGPDEQQKFKFNWEATLRKIVKKLNIKFWLNVNIHYSLKRNTVVYGFSNLR